MPAVVAYEHAFEGKGDAAEAADDLVAALAEEDLSDLPASAVGQQLVELRRTIDRLELEFSRRLGHFGRQRGYFDDGATNARCLGPLAVPAHPGCRHPAVGLPPSRLARDHKGPSPTLTV